MLGSLSGSPDYLAAWEGEWQMRLTFGVVDVFAVGGAESFLSYRKGSLRPPARQKQLAALRAFMLHLIRLGTVHTRLRSLYPRLMYAT
jgi:hypothetical protein